MRLLQTTARRRLHGAILIAVALAARVAAVVVLAGPTDRPVTYEHGAIAENLLAGRGFSVWFLGSEGPTSQQAPWVPCLLAACYAVFGVGTKSAIVAYQLLQCAAGAAVVVAAVRLAWNVLPERRGVGWAVGWLAALYPPHVYMATHVQAATWATLAATTLLAIASRRDRPVTARTAASFGALTGWSLLVDPILALVAAAGLAALVVRSSAAVTLARACRTPAVALACTLLVVAPWLVRNYRVHGEFVFVKSSFGYALWQGNNPLSWGTDKIPKPEAAAIAAQHDGTPADRNRALWEARHETLYIDDVLLKPGGYREFAGLTEPQRSRRLAARAVEFIRSRPADYAELCLRRLGYFLLWDRTNPKAADPIYRASSIAWFTLSAVGLLAARRSWSRLWPSMTAFVLVTLFHALTITSARFRLPIEPIGLVWAAAGLSPAVSGIALRIAGAWRAARQADDAGHDQAGENGLHGPHRRPSSLVRGRSHRRR